MRILSENTGPPGSKRTRSAAEPIPKAADDFTRIVRSNARGAAAGEPDERDHCVRPGGMRHKRSKPQERDGNLGALQEPSLDATDEHHCDCPKQEDASRLRNSSFDKCPSDSASIMKGSPRRSNSCEIQGQIPIPLC